MVILSKHAAKHASDMLKGIIAHPFWNGIDRAALQEVVDALDSGAFITPEPDPLPSWGIPGDKMIFLNRGGYTNQIARAQQFFREGESYTIERTEIGSSNSSYKFEGIDETFNTVMFDYADPEAIRKDWNENRARREEILKSSETYINLRDWKEE